MVTRKVLFFFLTICSVSGFAQTDHEKQGMQALMKGDFRSAVSVLEKADLNTPNNINVVKMLSYAYYQTGENKKSVTSYSKLLSLKSDDASAYYYRGKARLNIANDPKEAQSTLREEFYLAAIKDFTKAIELNSDNEIQYYQNRGIAYKDYGVFKSYSIKKPTDKVAVVNIFNNSIKDFQKILVAQPLRKDIIDLEKYVKAQITSLK
ncbi:tetratricopeptide repeat protein [Pedobacter flavus]|uniref:Tetratricopeptide repeat protein n=1 Tax=Pedobacter flavus TaxID=3113906 RepID=A0ABU7GXY0_9SPHI|nr:tetratricopeptide repeat protein [Pedobacter sp. VNH31]MEE1883841.1 tetratricopeptide repeat protein [Pedobacter sp. VNH31]